MTENIAPVGAPCWIDLSTSDPQAARDFYTQIFGWEVAVQHPEEYGGYILFSKNGKMVAGMGRKQSDWAPDAWNTYLRSSDITKTANDIKANNGQIIVDVMEVGDQGKMLIASDPTAAVFGVWEPIKHNGFEILNNGLGTPAWFEVVTQDYSKDLDFYTQVFGWETKTLSDSDTFQYSQGSVGQTPIAGIMNAEGHFPPTIPSFWSNYFVVDDINDFLQKLQAAGGEKITDPKDTDYGKVVTVKDITGAMFSVAGK